MTVRKSLAALRVPKAPPMPSRVEKHVIISLRKKEEPASEKVAWPGADNNNQWQRLESKDKRAGLWCDGKWARIAAKVTKNKGSAS